MKQATMKPTHLHRSLLNMDFGSAWVNPWALWVDSEHKCWLNLNVIAWDFPGDRTNLKVTNEGKGWYCTLYTGGSQAVSRETNPYRWRVEYERKPLVEFDAEVAYFGTNKSSPYKNA